MSADIHALEARIRANPDDAENWKVYGDWLIDQGDRRGELISLEALVERTGDVAIRKLIADLIDAHQHDWTPRFAERSELAWRHGFVRAVALRNISDPYQIQRLALLLDDPRARLVTELRLDFAESIDEDGRADLLAELLALVLVLVELRSLRVAYHAWGDALAHALVQLPTIALTHLDLRYSGLTNAGLIELAHCERLTGLRTLYLQHNAFTAEGLTALASSPSLSQLETLDLRYNEIDAHGASALAQSPWLGALTNLYLYAADLDTASIHALASSTTLPRDLVRFWRAQAQLAARGETPHAASLGLFAQGFVAETCSTPGTAAFRLRALDENPGARATRWVSPRAATLAMTDARARLRDRFFALHASGSDLDKQRFQAEVDALDGEPTTRVQGLSLAYHPSARFKQLRFIDAALLDAGVRPLFARPCAELPELAAVFVDPEELCFRSFENIIGLDRMFTPIGPRALKLGKPVRVRKGIFKLSTDFNEALQAQLQRLDQLDLYVRPLNAASRGGRRFIFHCTALAEVLTVALRRALAKSLSKSLLEQFSHVNPVFRCNRFEPGDEPFLEHVDSPYYDRSRNHVSKYTLLLYLTGGRGDAVLRFGDGPAIREIEPMTAFVFDQRLAHSGGPYLDGRKLFLRTELVFEDTRVEHEPGVAELFAKACYLTGESVFAPELARFAHEAYDRAAAAHWRGLVESTEPTPFMHKQFRGVHFVTNGYDYWFRKGDPSLVECAALALFDVLNVKVGDASFHKLCSNEVLIRASDDRAWIRDFLHALAPPAEPVFAQSNKPALFPEPEQPSDDMYFPSSPDFSPDPFPDNWDATRHPMVIDDYNRTQHSAKQRILPAPITILGRELFLDPERFVVETDRIHVLSQDAVAPLHFAGAVYYVPGDFIGVDVTLGALRLLVPPILFREHEGVVHLMLDLFRNSWMVRHRVETVPVPRVVDGRDIEPATSPWDTAVASNVEPEPE